MQGRDTTRRGPDVAQQALWTVAQMQELLDQWLVGWLYRPHEGLRDPAAAGRDLTPNEKYVAWSAQRVRPGRALRRGLHRAAARVFRTINAYGLTRSITGSMTARSSIRSGGSDSGSLRGRTGGRSTTIPYRYLAIRGLMPTWASSRPWIICPGEAVASA